MNPTETLAILLADFIFTNYQAAEIVDEDTDMVLLTRPVLSVEAVLELLKMCGSPNPNFKGWAEGMTDEKLKGQDRTRYQVANKIQAAMKEKGITQADLAKMLNKEPSHINRLLSGKNMTINSIVMLQNVLQITILDLS